MYSLSLSLSLSFGFASDDPIRPRYTQLRPRLQSSLSYENDARLTETDRDIDRSRASTSRVDRPVEVVSQAASQQASQPAFGTMAW